jgi:hypothetical protein
VELASWRVTVYFGTFDQPHRPTVALSAQATTDNPQQLVADIARANYEQHGPALSFMCANLDALTSAQE